MHRSHFASEFQQIKCKIEIGQLKQGAYNCMASEEEELCPRLYGTLESFLTSHQQYEDSQALQEHMTLNRHWLAKLPNSNWSSNVS